jgi:hypothetical protein
MHEGSGTEPPWATRAPRIAGMVPAKPRASRTNHTGENTMKIKSNVRAGAGAQKQNSKSINNTVVTYIPPVSRCVGI